MSIDKMIIHKPSLCLVATGGTIAGQHLATTQSSSVGLGYESGKVPPDALLKASPDVNELANWRISAPYQAGSQHATYDHWLKLRDSIILALVDPEVEGLLVTHGTDTLEEMLYFLWLTLPRALVSKPVIVTGAMAPSHHPAADGPANLMCSTRVLVASTKSQAMGHRQTIGMLALCLNGQLIHPLHVRKSTTHGPGAFDTEFGCPVPTHGAIESPQWLQLLAQFGSTTLDGLGEFAGLAVFSGHLSETELAATINRPRIDVLVCHVGLSCNSVLLEALMHNPPQVLVVAALGHGNIPNYLIEPLLLLKEKGVKLIRASRAQDGGVVSTRGSEPCGLCAFDAGKLTWVKVCVRERLLALCDPA